MSTNRGATWSNEVLTLISVWGDERIQQQLESCSRKIPIYNEISERMLKEGYKRSPEQCKEKIKKLKTYYKTVKDCNNRSGNGRKAWKYFDQLDAILGERPSIRPPSILDSGLEDCQQNCSALTIPLEDAGEISETEIYGLPARSNQLLSNSGGDISSTSTASISPIPPSDVPAQDPTSTPVICKRKNTDVKVSRRSSLAAKKKSKNEEFMVEIISSSTS